MASLGKPLVAAVNGDAHAGGFGVDGRLRSGRGGGRRHFRSTRGGQGVVPVHRTRNRARRAAEEGAVRGDLHGAPHARGGSAVAARDQRSSAGVASARPGARARRAGIGLRPPTSWRSGAGSTTEHERGPQPKRSPRRARRCSPRSTPPIARARRASRGGAPGVESSVMRAVLLLVFLRPGSAAVARPLRRHGPRRGCRTASPICKAPGRTTAPRRSSGPPSSPVSPCSPTTRWPRWRRGPRRFSARKRTRCSATRSTSRCSTTAVRVRRSPPARTARTGCPIATSSAARR